MKNIKKENQKFSFQFFIGGSVFSTIVYFMLALGSGLSPKLTFFSIFILFAVGGFFRKYLKEYQVYVIFILFIILTLSMFKAEVNFNFKKAKNIAKNTAISVEAFKNHFGFWPQSIDDLPEQKTTPDIVAGFFVTYKFKGDMPKLVVGRRDLTATWDWVENEWK